MHSLGLRFWGMVLLPTAPRGTASSASPYSGFISVYTSRAMRASVPHSIASAATYSARWSRAVRAGSSITAMSSCEAKPRCTAGPRSPREARVPAPPPYMARKVRGSSWRRRSSWRSSSSIQVATLKPNVIGRACWPWVRPAMA